LCALIYYVAADIFKLIKQFASHPPFPTSSPAVMIHLCLGGFMRLRHTGRHRPAPTRCVIELGRGYGAESLASECIPSLDIFETVALEIAVDVPSVGGGIRAAPRTGIIS